ncbi:response regulator [Croceimicrobium hydrocarbonivorans]|uniref:Response regulator n=1 Tax=Croceimicrobium hydrocarbonivorans TaxID=2761580 RepID=A0A7H0VBJ1_9FLAO|nr:response regulator [Croceimicrobium hydrocarbonivorans]QNR23089.1 response regulator [Croceimicrobium hydrocarbonivorans]
MRILVLEDNQFIASIITASLKSSESELLIVKDQFEAEKYFKEQIPDILISDIHMEQGTSLDFLKEVRKYPQTKVVVVSSDFERLMEVEENIGLKNWSYISKNNRKWLMLIKTEILSFLKANNSSTASPIS